MRIRNRALAWGLQAALVGTAMALTVVAPAEAACPTSEPDCQPAGRGTTSGTTGSGTTASGTTVTGLFRYTDRSADGSTFLRPITSAKV